MKYKLYKFLRANLKSDNGTNRDWEIGTWRKEDDIDICNKGFHSSKTPLQSLGYVKGEIIAEVEVRGESIIQDDKECWSEMCIVKAWHWTKEDSVSLAIFCAEQVLDIFEKKYPNDDRPRKAIEVAKAWLASPTKENAYAAANAAVYAADATNAAANATNAAANAANARKELIKKIDAWFEEKIKTLKKYE